MLRFLDLWRISAMSVRYDIFLFSIENWRATMRERLSINNKNVL